MKTQSRPILAVLICALLAAVPTFGQGGPPGAAVVAFHVADAANGVIFAATDSGVFRSADFGETWSPFSAGLPGLTVTAVVGRPNQLFVSLDGAGVYRSRNGEAWEQVSDGIGATARVLTLAADPNDPNILYAGTDNNGVFFSNNAGDGWIRPGGQVLNGGNFLTIAFDPNDPTRIFAGGRGGILFESTDAGRSWNPVAAGVVFQKVRFDPSNPGRVYVATSLGLARRDAPGQQFGTNGALGALTVLDAAVEPTDPNTVYASTQEAGLLVSRDGGASWLFGGVGLPRAFALSLLALPQQPPRLLAGLNGTGVFASTDQAASWAFSAEGMNGGDVLAVAPDPNNADVVFASLPGGGLFRSDDSGDTWSESRQGLTVQRPRVVAIDPTDSNRMYVGSVDPFDSLNGALLQSTDGGAVWNTLATGAPMLSIALHPTDGRTVWIGSSSGTFFFPQAPLLLSTDAGQSFRSVVGDDGILLRAGDVTHVALDPQDPRNMVVATSDRFAGFSVLWSDDAGDEFRLGASVSGPVGALLFDPTDPRRVFFGTTDGVIARSDDRGQNFTVKTSGLPTDEIRIINSIAIDPSDGAVYASTGASVFRSDDSGETWVRKADGIDQRAIRRVAVDPQRPGVVYAATSGNGVFRTFDRGETWAPALLEPLRLVPEGVTGAMDFSPSGGIAPGEVLAVFGQGMGPLRGVSATLDDQGKLPTELAGVQVFFNGVAAPLFFVSSRQINCQVPYEVVATATVRVRISFEGRSIEVVVPRTNARPGVFPIPLNQDFSLNNAETPARADDVIQLFLTGQGLLDAPIMSGQVAPSSAPFPAPVLPVEVIIGGQVARTIFVGMAPGLVGLLQINVRIPAGLGTGEKTIVVRIGSNVTPVAGRVFLAE